MEVDLLDLLFWECQDVYPANHPLSFFPQDLAKDPFDIVSLMGLSIFLSCNYCKATIFVGIFQIGKVKVPAINSLPFPEDQVDVITAPDPDDLPGR